MQVRYWQLSYKPERTDQDAAEVTCPVPDQSDLSRLSEAGSSSVIMTKELMPDRSPLFKGKGKHKRQVMVMLLVAGDCSEATNYKSTTEDPEGTMTNISCLIQSSVKAA